MRLHRIYLRNYRGVEESTVEFATTGVTIVEGPNEIGKTSIADAFSLLLDVKHDSQKQDVKDVKPVHADVAPYVEAEFTTGPYRLVYAKQWLRQSSAELTVLEPVRESLTGLPAHERVLQILAETVDMTLFRALRYQQGERITQALLSTSRSLAAALDAAAGGEALAGSETDDDLWTRVEDERAKYVYANGKKIAAREKKDEELKAKRAAAATLAAELLALEESAERHRTMGLELTENARDQEEQGKALEELRAAAERVGKARDKVERLAAARQAAEGIAREAAMAATERERLATAVADAERELADLVRAAEQDAPGLTAAREAHAAALAARDQARADRERAEQAGRLADADFEHFREALELEQLTERLTRVVAAEATIDEANRFLEACALDEAGLAAIEDAMLEAAVAHARAGEGGTAVTVEALAPVRIALGGERVELAAGERLQRTVTGDAVLDVGDMARITVAGQAEGVVLGRRAEEATGRLGALYAAAGIDGTAEDALARAKALVRRRQVEEAALASARTALGESLRDLTRSEIEGKVARGQERVATYVAARAAAPPFPTDREAAKDAQAATAAVLDAARRAEQLRQVALDEADAAARAVHDSAQERTVRIQLATAARDTAEQVLRDAAAAVPGEELASALAAASAAARSAAEAHEAAVRELASADPGSTEALLRNTEDRLARLRDDHQRLLIGREKIKAVLDDRGQAGLADQLDARQSEVLRLEREIALTDGRAAAAELLHQRLAARRDEARRAYVAPFKAQLDSFARLVFGKTASVEVDHVTLEIASRTLEGHTVPYESLSGGAREQLSVLSRLACAALVSPAGGPGGGSGDAGGVPVIFDDALGYSDPGRLARLGAAFNVAGDRCQVIVLTCMPDRYAHIGSAKVVRLEEGG